MDINYEQVADKTVAYAKAKNDIAFLISKGELI